MDKVRWGPCLGLTLSCTHLQTLLGIRPGQALGAGPPGPRRPPPPSIPKTGQPRGPRTANAGTSAGSSTRESGLWMRAACLLPPDL